MAAAAKADASPGMDRADLKKALKLARHREMNVAFGLDGDGKAIIMCDKMKKGPNLFRQMKQDAPDSKNHRFGILQMDPDNQKLAIFTVNKAGGGLARKLIKTLKGTGCSKVVIKLEDGSEVEAHEEEDETGEVALADDDDDDEDDAGEADAGAKPAAPVDVAGGATAADADGASAGDAPAADAAGDAMPQAGDAPPPATADAPQGTGLDATALAADLTGLVKQMLAVIAADPTKKVGLAELATEAQASLKRGDLEQASAGIDVLREALDAGTAAGGQPSANADTATAPDPSAAPATDTPATTASDPNGAAPPADPSAGQAGASPAPNAGTPDPSALTSSLTDLVKQMLPIIAADPTQQDAMRGIAQQAQAGLKGGDLDTAAGHIEQLRGLIDGWSANGAATNGAANGAAPNGAAANGAATNGATPNGAGQPNAAAAAAAPAIAKARTAWVATRQKVEGDLGKLHAAFGDAFKGHDQEEQISKAFRDRVETVLNTLDEGLSHTLDAVNNAKDPDERQQLVQQAHVLLQKYQQHVASDPTIAALDSNPFVPMAVQKTMNATIDALSRSIR